MELSDSQKAKIANILFKHVQTMGGKISREKLGNVAIEFGAGTTLAEGLKIVKLMEKLFKEALKQMEYKFK